MAKNDDVIAAVQSQLNSIAQDVYNRGSAGLESQISLARKRGSQDIMEDIGKKNLFLEGGGVATPGQSQLLDFFEGLENIRSQGLVGLETQRGNILSQAAQVPLQGLGMEEEEDDTFANIANAVSVLLGQRVGGATKEFAPTKTTAASTTENLPITYNQEIPAAPGV